MVKIRFLGSCQEIGRSGVLIESDETSDAILCDYGTKMDYAQLFPEHVSGKNLSAIVLSHSHIDHIGGAPLFYISGSVPLYCTELTYKVSEILLFDMLNISKDFLPFDKGDPNFSWAAEIVISIVYMILFAAAGPTLLRSLSKSI